MAGSLGTWTRFLPLGLALAELPLVMAAEDLRLTGTVWAAGEAPPADAPTVGVAPVGVWPGAQGSLAVDDALVEGQTRRVAWPVFLAAFGLVGALWPRSRRG